MSTTDKKMKINIDFGYDRTNDKDNKIPSNQRITANYLSYGVKLGFKDGLPADKRRLFDCITDKLEEAVKANAEDLALNSYEYMFLVQAFEKAVCPVEETKSFSITERALLEAKGE